MIIYNSRGLRWGEIWFDEAPDPRDLRDIDLLFYHQRSSPIHPRRWQYYYTILVDLSVSADQLLANMSKHTAKEIRRARDIYQIQTAFVDVTEEAVIEFIRHYNMFAQSKGLAILEKSSLDRLREENLLAISKASTGDALIFLSYVRHMGQSRARALYGGSLFSKDGSASRSLVGRANRLLHYQAMLTFKSENIRMYDFGGWYAGSEDEKRLGINRFKENFGGKIAYGYDCVEPVSLKGRIYLLLRAAKRKFMDPQARREWNRRRTPVGVNQKVRRGLQG